MCIYAKILFDLFNKICTLFQLPVDNWTEGGGVKSTTKQLHKRCFFLFFVFNFLFFFYIFIYFRWFWCYSASRRGLPTSRRKRIIDIFLDQTFCMNAGIRWSFLLVNFWRYFSFYFFDHLLLFLVFRLRKKTIYSFINVFKTLFRFH